MAVEIAYALLPSAALVVVGVAVGLAMSYGFGLHGPAWGTVGAIGVMVLMRATALRTVVILAKGTSPRDVGEANGASRAREPMAEEVRRVEALVGRNPRRI